MKTAVLLRSLAALVGILAINPDSLRAQIPNSLYVGEAGGNAVGTVNETVGTASASLVTGLAHPAGIAVSGNNLYVANSNTGVVGEYNATTGVAVNASLLTLPNGASNLPGGMVVAGGLLYIVSGGTDTVGVYNATTGATVNAAFIQNVPSPFGLAISGNNLYVTSQFNGLNTGTVSEYNATTGATISNTLISSTAGLQGIAVSGNTLFLVNNAAGTIGSYNATTGLAINAGLVANLSTSGLAGLVIVGNTLYVAENNAGTVGAFDATTGGAVFGFVSPVAATLNGPTFLAVSVVPEPSTWVLLGVGACGLVLLTLRRRHAHAA